jgi:hypothetical protein
VQNENLGHCLRLIQCLGLELEGVNMNIDVTDTYHTISHRMQNEIIIPTVAITNTFDFFMYNNATKNIKMADNTKCVVLNYEEKHICELEDDIKRLYGIDAWTFIKKWYAFFNIMTNMMMVKIYLKEV